MTDEQRIQELERELAELREELATAQEVHDNLRREIKRCEATTENERLNASIYAGMYYKALSAMREAKSNASK